jgi:hypothetical protein
MSQMDSNWEMLTVSKGCPVYPESGPKLACLSPHKCRLSKRRMRGVIAASIIVTKPSRG